MKRWRRVIGIGALVVLAVLVGGLVWFAWPQQVLPEAQEALVPSPSVSVEQSDGRLTFTPSSPINDTGFILYPGGKVPPDGYAVPARAIAEQGYLVVVPSTPLNFAVF